MEREFTQADPEHPIRIYIEYILMPIPSLCVLDKRTHTLCLGSNCIFDDELIERNPTFSAQPPPHIVLSTRGHVVSVCTFNDRKMQMDPDASHFVRVAAYVTVDEEETVGRSHTCGS